MIYDNNNFGQQADGVVTHLIATNDNGRTIASNNVKEFAAELGCSVGRVYEILRQETMVYPYVGGSRVKDVWFMQCMPKKRAEYLYTDAASNSAAIKAPLK